MIMELPKRVLRSRQDRVLFGVCGGIAEYLSIDPVIVRFIFSVLFFTFWIGVVLYIAGMIMFPVEPVSKEESD